tara:strand:- start:4 stop:156 length:153 start_codon:yes stop_codon:yes gene_type:complete
MKFLVLLLTIIAVIFFWCGYEYGIAKTAKSETDANCHQQISVAQILREQP